MSEHRGTSLQSGLSVAKPFVERVIGTVKYEYLEKHQPLTFASVEELLTDYPYFYNHDRPNQALVCDNQSPYRDFRYCLITGHGES